MRCRIKSGMTKDEAGLDEYFIIFVKLIFSIWKSYVLSTCSKT